MKHPTLLLVSSEEKNNDVHDASVSDPKKPKSRLAQLAEDWLEEEEDELVQYWERFDENKRKKEYTQQQQQQQQQQDDDNTILTTEDRLERYYDRRGINKKKEREHETEIRAAIQTARQATTPDKALDALRKVQPYLQVSTQLGGNALYELAIALWQKDGTLDEELCEELLRNRFVRSKLQRLLQRKEPPSRQPSLWQNLFQMNLDNF